MFEELFACEVALVDALLFESFDDFGFGSDRGVVGTRCPTSVLTLEACATHEDILDGVVEYVSHVQYACHVWWRDDYGVCLTLVGGTVE
jgi:hypothetical protein